MDHVITRIAKVSVTAAALLAGPALAAVSSDGTETVPIMRRIPPVETIRRIPPVTEEIGQTAEVAYRTQPTPAMRRLPDVGLEEPTPELAGPEFRRLPEVIEEELISDAQHASQYLTRWNDAAEALTSVGHQARRSTAKGYKLAEKGALYSARAEFIEALRSLALGLDAHYGDSVHTDSLLGGIRALKEADDFAANGSSLEMPLKVSVIAASHHTQLPPAADLTDISPVLAMQHYYAFAQQHLVVAAGGSTFAAEPLYGLGKVYMEFAQQAQNSDSMHAPKAMAYMTAALQVDPGHALAANELGVMYARLGKLREARQMLQQSVSAVPMAESWENLASVHDRLGEAELAQLAMSQANRASRELRARRGGGSVQWLEPEAFAGFGDGASSATGRTASKQPHFQ